MIYHSNGGFTWNDAYYMPTKLREFYFGQLLKIKDTETKNYEKVSNAAKNKTTPSKTIRK
jgi:hypothetical protein